MLKMKVLVIGGGGREHALVNALLKSDRVSEVVCAPGNGGIAQQVRCVPVKQDDLADLMRVVEAENPGLTVVGPELPLSIGFVDEMLRLGRKAFGPTKAAARLESSKAFSKAFMQRHKIPTARYAICVSANEVEEALELFSEPVVVKADGLAAGKGVVICETKAEAMAVARDMFTGGVAGKAGKRLVLEEFLEGEEVSFLLLSDGVTVAPLPPAQDHKRIGEGDTGANTGGMGAYSMDTLVEPEMRNWLIDHVAKPTIQAMAAEGAKFVGVLYCGLMLTARGPMVLEFNARFGDPETQAILLRLESDLLTAFEACVDGTLSGHQMQWRAGASACVVAASGGYPGKFSIGKEIHGLDAVSRMSGVKVFHAGTIAQDRKLLTSGGRVLVTAAESATLQGALAQCYAAMEKIEFDGMVYRRDIGHRALSLKDAAEAKSE
jgi:phosphoribosylamine--glycine ligase